MRTKIRSYIRTYPHAGLTSLLKNFVDRAFDEIRGAMRGSSREKRDYLGVLELRRQRRILLKRPSPLTHAKPSMPFVSNSSTELEFQVIG